MTIIPADPDPAPSPLGPAMALDRKGRRFLALTQPEADAMRDEWERTEARQRGRLAAAWVRLRQWWAGLGL